MPQVVRGIVAMGSLTRNRLVMLLGSWVLVIAATGVDIPRLNPALTLARPMETLATALLLVPCVLTVNILQPQCAWLLHTSARAVPRWRLALLSVVVAPQALVAAAIALLVHAPVGQVEAVWLLLLSLCLLGMTWIGAVAAGMLPLAVVAVFSRASGIPLGSGTCSTTWTAPANWCG